jgi:murein DD-endopeptidase MepM/ murein hydrolase activator NlpD
MVRLDAPRAVLPIPTSTPLPTATSTLEPALTATPIPISLIVWQPTLPQEGGWSGAASCSGTYYAPVGSGAFVWPTDDHYLSGKNYNALWHPGLDLSAWYGEPVYAADAGVTVYAGWNAWGYGNMVVVDHGNGWHTLYGHLSQVSVSCAQSVERGGVIGLAGSTGRSTGPHLHFEMRHDTWGRVNPWHYLP